MIILLIADEHAIFCVDDIETNITTTITEKLNSQQPARRQLENSIREHSHKKVLTKYSSNLYSYSFSTELKRSQSTTCFFALFFDVHNEFFSESYKKDTLEIECCVFFSMEPWL